MEFTTLQALLDGNIEEVNIKKSTLFRVDEIHDAKKIRSASKYLELCQKHGLLAGLNLGSLHLKQEVKNTYQFYSQALLSEQPYFFNVTSTEKKLRMGLSQINSLQEYKINSISGICLFGGTHVALENDAGEYIPLVDFKKRSDISKGSIKRLRINTQFSLYEIEKIKRITHFINFQGEMNQNFKKSFIVFPQVQYYLYLIPLYIDNIVSSEIVQEWIIAVDTRIQVLTQAIKKRLNTEVHFQANPLDPLRDVFISRIAKKEFLSIEEGKRILSDCSSLWETVLTVYRIANWNDIIHASYVVAFLQQSLDLDENEILLHVDDPIEKVKLNELSRIRKKLMKTSDFSSPSIFGVYPLQNVILNSSELDANIYHLEGGLRNSKALLNLMSVNKLHSD